ncbi:ribosomal-protein-serine acetyltransferase [Marinococcus luteus]|jgi:ribosomal-protein-serine acetyltransferase|uniref:Ribosomal-protein-serine acetyltransferase n=1 Tax=Marinococcus luteus TaxID=1122204 RepID=A0A1H2X2C8_9BACI|nr:GNAT family N-acetyltransferase [Marinococcus luteus]SDW86896.1 ribosomal-protein-serine acetyltransferase [Marinococcus luteus]
MFAYKINDRLELLLLQKEHAGELFALIDKNREHLKEWMNWVDNVQSAQDTAANIERTLQQAAAGDGFRAGIRFEGDLVGVINYHEVDWGNKKTSLGYWLGEEYEGKGIMTQAVEAFTNYAFDRMDLHRVEIRCAEKNKKSRAVPEKLGFHLEGTLKESERLAGGYVNQVVYGMVNTKNESS